MSRRSAAWLAWSMCALSLALTALSLLLLDLNLSHPETHVYAPWLDNVLSAVSFAPVGALIASRRPANPVGWLLCLYGLVISISHFGAEYAIYALLEHPGSLPAGHVAAWIVSWILPVVIGITVFFILLFPTGRLPGGRWRWLARLTTVFILAGVLFAALSPGAPMGVLGPIRNPLGIEGFPDVYYKALLYAVSPVVSVAGASSLFVRLRRATTVQRQQIKWFVYAAAANVGTTTLAYIVPAVIDTPLLFERVAFALNIFFIPAIPISIGIAILRHRLYDIDVIINRTLVYGTLTGFLAVVYFGGVTATQAVFQTRSGQEDLPQFIIVASTLAIAALFHPLRRRIQSFIDRRFYRKKYDAVRIMGAFNATLRDETDLRALGDDLLRVVGETIEPVHASLWLRPEGTRGGRRADQRPSLPRTFSATERP